MFSSFIFFLFVVRYLFLLNFLFIDRSDWAMKIFDRRLIVYGIDVYNYFIIVRYYCLLLYNKIYIFFFLMFR